MSLSNSPAAVRARQRRERARIVSLHLPPVAEPTAAELATPASALVVDGNVPAVTVAKVAIAQHKARSNKLNTLRALLTEPRTEDELVGVLAVTRQYLKTMLSDVKNAKYSRGPTVTWAKNADGKLQRTDI